MEGFCSLVASMIGAGTGLSSFRDNVGVLSVTKVDTRHDVSLFFLQDLLIPDIVYRRQKEGLVAAYEICVFNKTRNLS